MSSVEQYKDHFVLLLEAGFIAVNQADEDSARKLFKGAQLLNPESSLPRIGLGYLHFHKLELAQAVAVFDQVLEKEPNNQMAMTFKGMSLSLTPNKMDEGEKILKEIAEKAATGDVKEVADSTIQFVDKFIKKAPSPAEIKKK